MNGIKSPHNHLGNLPNLEAAEKIEKIEKHRAIGHTQGI